MEFMGPKSRRAPKGEPPPAFLKFFLSQKSSTRLALPYTNLAFPESAVLEDQNHNKWKMKMELQGAIWCFTDGWVEFMNDNRLVDGDVIIWEYICEGLFSFQILDLSACGKIIFGPFRFCQDSSPIGDEYNDREVEDPIHEDGGNIGDALTHDKGVEDNTVLENEDNIGDALTHDKGVEDNTVLENEDNLGDGPTHDNEVEDPLHENEDNIGGSGKRGRGDEDREENGRGRKRRLRQLRQWHGNEIFAAGLAPRPTNPYFVMKLKSTHRPKLYVPRHILRMHGLELPPTMKIVDPRGQSFALNRNNNWENDKSRMYYSGGWRVLCGLNLLNPGDDCIVEFVEAATGILEARVSFVRAKNNV